MRVLSLHPGVTMDQVRDGHRLPAGRRGRRDRNGGPDSRGIDHACGRKSIRPGTSCAAAVELSASVSTQPRPRSQPPALPARRERCGAGRTESRVPVGIRLSTGRRRFTIVAVRPDRRVGRPGPTSAQQPDDTHGNGDQGWPPLPASTTRSTIASRRSAGRSTRRPPPSSRTSSAASASSTRLARGGMGVVLRAYDDTPGPRGRGQAVVPGHRRPPGRPTSRGPCGRFHHPGSSPSTRPGRCPTAAVTSPCPSSRARRCPPCSPTGRPAARPGPVARRVRTGLPGGRARPRPRGRSPRPEAVERDGRRRTGRVYVLDWGVARRDAGPTDDDGPVGVRDAGVHGRPSSSRPRRRRPAVGRVRPRGHPV